MNFKDKARLHQFNFFKESERQIPSNPSRERAQSHWLNEEAAKNGKIFYNDYNVFSKAKSIRGNKSDVPEWFLDTLRSQHIPFNFFIPFIEEKELAKNVFNQLYNLDIVQLTGMQVEFPSRPNNPIKDNTSMDVFLSYLTSKSKKGFLGFEIKYTEGAYSPTATELSEANNMDSLYYKKTKESGLWKEEHIHRLKENSYRQIWRNHLLAHEWKVKEGYDEFLSITIHPEGNEHFIHSLHDYKTFLTDKGLATLYGTTYEDFFKSLSSYTITQKQNDWVNYLIARYIVI